MKYRLMAFMAGRHGLDALSNTLAWGAIIVMLVTRWIPNQIAQIIVYYAAVAAFIYAYYRVMSRNLPKRELENAAFKGFFLRRKLNFQQRKTHKFFGCPQCQATLRVPKGRGKVTITCNRCGRQFTKRT